MGVLYMKILDGKGGEKQEPGARIQEPESRSQKEKVPG